jgi:cyclic pyranopterin phosphate synthase
MDQAVSSVRAAGSSSLLTDRYGRDISYLRVSVTDRCNLRCFYCMRQDVMFLPKAEVLSLEEMERLCRAFVRLGIRKLRLTGGGRASGQCIPRYPRRTDIQTHHSP